MVRTQARILSGQLRQRLNQQSGADQQHQGQRDFCHHECVPQPPMSGATSTAATALFQGVVHIGLRGLQGGGQTEKHPGEHRQRQREPEHGRVDLQHG